MEKEQKMKHKLVWSLAAAFQIPTAFAVSAVNWQVMSLANMRRDERYISCKYQDVLKERPAKKEGDPTVPTLHFKQASEGLSPTEEKICENSLTNLMGLDEIRFRDELAKKFKNFPCDKVEVVTEAREDTKLKTIYPNAKSLWKTQFIDIKTCVKEQPEYCRFPLGARMPDANTIANYDALLLLVDLCLEQTESAIRAGAELNAWKKQNDPNKPAGSGEEHRED